MPSNIDVVPAPPEQRHSRLPYLPGLDGLRALAVIAVLLFHAGVEVPGGFLGVESFFVLSGFLITGLLLAEWRTNGRVSLRAFWLRRARRLLPALVLVLAVTLLYTVAFLPRELAEVRSHVLSALLYVLNWQMVWSQQPYFDPTVRPPLLQHLWSLAVEEQFYLIWPLLFVGVMRSVRATGLLLLTLAGAAASAILMAVLVDPGGDPSRVYYGTDTRAAGLLLGAALAVVWQPGQPPAATRRDVGSLLEIAGVLALGTLMVVYRLLSEQQGLLYPWGFLLVDLSTALVIMAVTHPQARMVPRLLAWQPLRWIGLRSYGIYLWHWPIFQITRPYLDVPLQGWLLLVLRLALVVGVAALSYRWVELPVRQGAIPPSWRRPWKWGTTVSAFGSLQALGGKRLRVPLAGLLVLVSVIWLARMATPRTAGGVAVLAPPTATTPAEGASRSSTALGTPTRGAGVSGAPTALSTPLPLDVPAAGGADRPELVATPAGNSTAPSPTVAPPPSDPVPLDPALAAELQRLLDETVADGFVPGAVLSISIPGYLPWSGASGIADRRLEVEMEPGTLVHLASLTKMFTAVVVLQLAEEGRIDLDAPIGTWLPEIVPLADRTTARHLLSHTSGVFDYLEDRRFFAEAYGNPERIYTPAELVDFVDQFGAAFEPGTEGAWKYASTNYVILGMLVEQVTGKTLAEEMRQRIFDPLQLTHTFFAPDEPLTGELAEGYIDSSDRSDVSMTFVYATGNLISTADDLRRFVDALFGGRLIDAEALAGMMAVVDTGGAYDMPELQYGLGLMRAQFSVGAGPDGEMRPDEVRTVFGHIGGIAGFRSAAWWAPESQITLALSINQADIDPNLLARDAFDAILTWQGR